MSKNKIQIVFIIICWALYDLANQFFALNVISVYFPRWLTLEKGSPEIFYSISFGVSMFLIALLGPLLGTLADLRGRQKPFLIFFTLLSIVFTCLIGLTSSVVWGLLFFILANLGCQLAVIFYNALLVDVAPENKVGIVSGLGRMFAYSGAVLAMALTKPIIQKWGYEGTFLVTGGCFLIFSLPALIFIKEKRPLKDFPLRSFLTKDRITQVFQKIRMTLSAGYEFAELRDFLKVVFFGLSAINVMILFMSIYASKAFGLNETQIIDLIVFSTLFAMIGSLVSGWISDRAGYKNALVGVFGLWLFVFVGGAFAAAPFRWVIGAVAGYALGSTWVITRAWVVRMAPRENIGEIFGLFNFVSYCAGIVGPLAWGLMLILLRRCGPWQYRLSLLSLSVFIGIAFVYLLKIPSVREKAKT
ncbi:MAG: MFS transporter [Candidatus Omnitrophota bacterium]